jgi:hypothetical protein
MPVLREAIELQKTLKAHDVYQKMSHPEDLFQAIIDRFVEVAEVDEPPREVQALWGSFGDYIDFAKIVSPYLRDFGLKRQRGTLDMEITSEEAYHRFLLGLKHELARFNDHAKQNMCMAIWNKYWRRHVEYFDFEAGEFMLPKEAAARDNLARTTGKVTASLPNMVLSHSSTISPGFRGASPSSVDERHLDREGRLIDFIPKFTHDEGKAPIKVPALPADHEDFIPKLNNDDDKIKVPAEIRVKTVKSPPVQEIMKHAHVDQSATLKSKSATKPGRRQSSAPGSVVSRRRKARAGHLGGV